MFWWNARVRADLAITSAQRVVLGAIGSRTETLTNLMLDYAAWDDASSHLGNNLDLAWADANLGSWIFNTGEVDFAFVTDVDGRVQYASREGKRDDRRVDELLSAELRRMIFPVATVTDRGAEAAGRSGHCWSRSAPARFCASCIGQGRRASTIH